MPPETAPERATYTVAEVAALIGISRNSAYEALRRGLIPGVIRIGRRLLVSRAALDAWLVSPAELERAALPKVGPSAPVRRLRAAG